MAGALNLALRHALQADEKVMLMGEDIGPLGGVFRVTDGLHAEFGAQRVVDTPLAESGIIGTAIGLAMRGYRPVCEIQRSEEHTSELQSRGHLVCRLLLEKKNKNDIRSRCS